MSIKLRDLIRNVRACKTAAEERAVITKECALIRTAFKEEKTQLRHRNVAKLLYIHMLGYSAHFGQIECLKLIASPTFYEKRIGYLGLMLLLTEKEEILTLVTNCLKNDLTHQNQFIVALSLTTIGNLATADIARDLALDVDKLLRSTNSYIRKKAALTTIRIIEKVPELAEDFIERIVSLLKDNAHGVMLTGVQLMINVIQIDPKTYTPHFVPLVSALVKLLRNSLSAGYSLEYDIGGIMDPFLQVNLLRLLGLLGKGNFEASDVMNDILAQVATNTETAKNAGNAILYECVQTIMNIEAENSLRVLAVNILGRFLLNSDNNIRYVALNTLSKVITVDPQAVQRHRTTIVECLKDPDVSIRQRALELIFQLVNESNVIILVRELLNYLVVSLSEFRPGLCSKITAVVERFSPSKKWRIDTFITMLSIAGNHCDERIPGTTIIYIAQSSELHAYSVHKLFKILHVDLNQQGLVHVAIWCIGEYGDKLLAPLQPIDDESPSFDAIDTYDVINMLDRIGRLHSSGPITKGLVLTAYLKLTERFDRRFINDLRGLIESFASSMSVEVQQRACEYLQLLDPNWADIKSKTLLSMPIIDEETIRVRREFESNGIEVPITEESKSNTNKSTSQLNSQNINNENGKTGRLDVPLPKPINGNEGNNNINLLDLNDLFGSTTDTVFPPTSGVKSAPVTQPQTSHIDLLSDIFSSHTITQPQPINNDPTRNLNSSIPLNFGQDLVLSPQRQEHKLIAFEKYGLVLTFSLSKPNGNLSQESDILCTFVNNSIVPVRGLVFQVAVPKYVKLDMRLPSGSDLPPNGSGTVTQLVKVTNSMLGEKGLMLKLRIQFEMNGQQFVETTQVSSIPSGY